MTTGVRSGMDFNKGSMESQQIKSAGTVANKKEYLFIYNYSHAVTCTSREQPNTTIYGHTI
jgi:hypothetical protein